MFHYKQRYNLLLLRTFTLSFFTELSPVSFANELNCLVMIILQALAPFMTPRREHMRTYASLPPFWDYGRVPRHCHPPIIPRVLKSDYVWFYVNNHDLSVWYIISLPSFVLAYSASFRGTVVFEPKDIHSQGVCMYGQLDSNCCS